MTQRSEPTLAMCMKGTTMIWEQPCERPLTVIAEDFAAELTEAAYPIALRHGAGIDWLDRKLELWHALTRTINAWEQQSVRHAGH
jgi:hypothetical protein